MTYQPTRADRMAQILSILQALPQGATAVELTPRLGISHKNTQNLLGRMAGAGSIARMKIGGIGNDNHTLRYYAHEHKPQAEHSTKPAEFRRAKQRTAAPARAFDDGEARITSETKVTICPPFVDRRFEFTPTPGWKGQITLDREMERGL